ncbi:ParB/RepB/Spo0J family partition protein [Floricoccus penangensis]|uniref:ParB/RepB/Spo0J family partition protein n=1 Tax=Floricoccus penangensis TaxID=1859475 RepID=UPI0020405C05|nr:ParB/RepB/Spo0J family partition protein [Floricoccus penangensis]URZ87477.1 ParB/RepB/Spo0J family partition protein [Floricoccus penangensis]
MKNDEINEEIKKIKISDITANPYQPRLNFNEEKLEELAKSIRENGILQPIIVRKSGVFGYQILAGERRFRASIIAGLDEIPAIVREISDQKMMTLSILENLQRDDMTAIEEAKAYKNLVDKTDMTHQEIAQTLGKSRPYVSNMIRILNLPMSILRLLDENLISPGHARVLLSLDNKNDQEKIAKQIITDKISVRQLENIVSSIKEKNNQEKKSKNKNIFSKEIEEILSRKFGINVSIKNIGNSKGKIEIPFSNLEELNRIIDDLL